MLDRIKRIHDKINRHLECINLSTDKQAVKLHSEDIIMLNARIILILNGER